MKRLIQYVALVGIAFAPNRDVCFGAWLIDYGPPGHYTDDFDTEPYFGFMGIEQTPFVVPPPASPASTNRYGKSANGEASLTILEAFGPSPPFGGWGQDIYLAFDWIALGAVHFDVIASGFPGPDNQVSAQYIDLPPAPPEWISVPESRRASLYIRYPDIFPAPWRDLQLWFRGTDALGAPAPFGVDNFDFYAIPEPVAAAHVVFAVIVFGSVRAVGRWKRMRRINEHSI